MSEPTSDADKIRNKRLAKLGSSTTPAPSATKVDSDDGPSSSKTAPPNTSEEVSGISSKDATSSASPPLGRQPNPFAQLGLEKNPDTSKPRIKITSRSNAGNLNLKRTREPSEATKFSSEEPIDIWESRTLESIFRITVDKTRRRDGGGYELRYLESLSKELDSEDAPLRLSNSLLEQALMEAGAYTSKAAPLDYLLPAWKRVCKQLRSMKSKVSNEKLEIVKEARRLCMSYCIFAATMPDMFGNSREGNPLVPHLLLDQDNDKGIDHEFLTELISRFSDEDASAQDAIILAVEELSQQLATRTMNDDYKPHVLALRNLVRYAGIVNAIVQSPRFLPETTAEKLEVDSILGPFFALSPLQGNVTLNYFSSPKTRDKNYIVSSQNALRMTARAHQADLLDIANHIIKTGKEPREKTLDWFASCVNLNHKRRAMQVDKKTVSSDAFMVNVTVCLDQLCEPFMDATFSKIDRIDANYLRRNPRVDIKEETKLNADQNASDEFYSTTADGQSNFISEVFFLALAAHHYGTEATHAMLSQLERELKHMEKQLGVLEADREKLAHAPMQLAMVDRALQKYREQVDKGLAYKFSAQGVLLDDLNQTRSMQFMRYVIVWLLRLVQPEHEYPKRPLTAPLPETLSQVFNCLPEYFLEDVVSNFKFIMRNMPQIITTTQSDELVTLCITFLRSSKYIKNPYLKAGLVTILFHGTWPTYGRAKGVLGDILNGNPFALEHLLHSLMKFYIEIETTGAHTQFYDKFNIRYEIFQIIKTIWGNTVYQERLAAESRGNLEFFVRFVNLLLNDVTYVLDESLSAFKKIHELQQLLKPDNAEGDALGEEARRDKEELLSEAENKAKNYMQLANETMAMLKLFTAALADSFTKPEVVQRLADMLDYNLDLMVGPKSSQLRVERPEDYGFNPRVLLSEIVDVFLNLGSKETFVVAVARDGRSYKPANLNKATQILKRWGLKSAQELDEWAKLGERFAKAKDMETQDEALFEDAPDEFNDPVLATLMEDPVILPSSRQIVDRSTIRSHLLSDPTDPFNRVPMKIEDVIPDTELRQKIEAYKAEKRGKRITMSDVMDTSAG